MSSSRDIKLEADHQQLDISNFPWANDTRNVGEIPLNQMQTILTILSTTMNNVVQNKRHYDMEARRTRIRKQYERESRKDHWIPDEDEDEEKEIMDALEEARRTMSRRRGRIEKRL